LSFSHLGSQALASEAATLDSTCTNWKPYVDLGPIFVHGMWAWRDAIGAKKRVFTDPARPPMPPLFVPLFVLSSILSEAR